MRRFCSLRSYSQFCIRIRNSQFRGLPAPTVLIFTVPVASSSAESLLCFITRPQIAQKCHKPANYPHKLTKTAEPWLGGGAALSGSELHAGVTSAALRSSRCALVAAAAAPPVGGRRGGRLLQLRVIALGGCMSWVRSRGDQPQFVRATPQSNLVVPKTHVPLSQCRKPSNVVIWMPANTAKQKSCGHRDEHI